jgi:long-chain acyl-CoA synthetase
MMLVHDLLRRTAGEHPDRTAMIAGTARVSYASWDRMSDALASALQANGLAKGHRCALILDNCPDLVVSIFGVLKAGGVFTVLSPATKEPRLSAILNDCGATMVIAAPGLAPRMAPLMERARSLRHVIWSEPPAMGSPSGAMLRALVTGTASVRDVGTNDADLAAIIYTSGTSGEPKGVMLTHRNLVNTTGVIAAYLRNTPDDVVSCILPMAFSYGLCQALCAAHTGYTMILERSFAYPADVLRRAASHRVTGLPGVPTMFARLLQMLPLDGIDLSSLRYVTNAAATIPPAHILRFREAFPNAAFYSMYGQTECTRAAFLDPGLVDSHPTSVGRAIAHSDVFIVDSAGRRLGPGQVGELVVRGANVMRGYWGRQAETSRALRVWDGERALFTGDDFRMDEAGLLYFVGRQDDIFKCRGEKVAPREVENAIYELRDIDEVAVIGVGDEMDGLAVKALVVPRAGSSLSESTVRRHCQARLESFMVPRYIEFRAALPRTESGKLKRSALAEPVPEGP